MSTFEKAESEDLRKYKSITMSEVTEVQDEVTLLMSDHDR